MISKVMLDSRKHSKRKIYNFYINKHDKSYIPGLINFSDSSLFNFVECIHTPFINYVE